MSPHGPYSELGLVEQPALELLEELGWEVVNAFSETLEPAGTLGRDSIHDVVLVHRLWDVVGLLNPDVPEHVREEAITAIDRDRSLMDRVRANREVHELLRDGYRSEWIDDHGDTRYATVRFVDFLDSREAGTRLAATGGHHRRCPPVDQGDPRRRPPG